MRSSFAKFAAAVALLTAVPLFAAARGKADFTTFVTLGDSLTLGVTNNAAVDYHQMHSWPAVFARQVGLKTDCTTDAPNCFQQALIGQPGLAPELVLSSLSPLTLSLKPGLGSPTNSSLARAYNNLSVDGAEVADAFNVDGDGNESFSAPIVLRGKGSMVDQALSLKPTFIAVWLGVDDVYSSGVLRGTATTLTPLADFSRDYNALLDKLITGAPNAGMVVSTVLTDVRQLPLVNLVPTVLVDPATNKPVLNPANGQPIPLIADLGGGNYGQLPAGSAILLPATTLLKTGYGIPAQLKPLIDPTNKLPDIGKPLPDSVTLTPTEINDINVRATEYNQVIEAAAAARNIPVMKIQDWIDQAAKGIHIGPVTVNTSYLTGGIVSVDGAHPSELGYLLIANEFIKTVERAYNIEIPQASITEMYENNGAMFGKNSEAPSFTDLSWWNSSEMFAGTLSAVEGASGPQRGRFHASGASTGEQDKSGADHGTQRVH